MDRYLKNTKKRILTKNGVIFLYNSIGEDILPKTLIFLLIDGFTKVTDKDAAVYTVKLLWRRYFVGNSAGLLLKDFTIKRAFQPEDVVVVLFHDSGSRYVGKI
jgi:cystathionine beta-synthase